MTKYVAFLRGINVGGRIIKMDDLKICFEQLGFQEVKTVLQTGNVIFKTPTKKDQLKQQIETALSSKFNYPAKVMLYSLEQLRVLIKDYPFGEAGPDQHDYVILIENGLERSLISETYVLAKDERVRAGNGVVYWQVSRGSTLSSSFAKMLTKTMYKDFNTNRNIKTLRRLLT